MDALDGLIDGGDETVSGPAIDQRRVVAQTEPARPGQRGEELPDSAELAEPLALHQACSSPPRRLLARRCRTPFARPGSLPAKNASAMCTYSLIVTRGGMSWRLTIS